MDKILSITETYLSGEITPHEYRNLLIVELMNLRLSRSGGMKEADDDDLIRIAHSLFSGDRGLRDLAPSKD